MTSNDIRAEVFATEVSAIGADRRGQSRATARVRKVATFLGRLRILSGIIFLGVAIATRAQVTNATLTGVVSDSANAAIPAAQLVIQNVQTGLKVSATTNDQGVYATRDLPPGSYSVTVDKEGFRQSVTNGVTLTVGQMATLNISLQVGNVNQTVTVAGNAELINTTSAELGSVVNERAISQLPLNGRDPSSLVFLTAGVTNLAQASGLGFSGGTANGFPTETAASSTGGRHGSTYYLLDGAPNMDTYQGNAAPFPNADATQEFRVISNNFDARYWNASGAVVSIQTKSGDNHFHGGAFEFIRNNDLNAANYFSHTVDPLKRNQFGAFVGGPILRDRLFFFVNYQATRSFSTATANVAYTPTQAMLNGDFSAVPITLNAPFETVDGKPNQIDPSQFSPGALQMAKTALPLGQVASTGQLNYIGPATRLNYDEGTARLDYTINSRNRVFLRSFTNVMNGPAQNVKGNMLAALSSSIGKDYNEAFGHTWIIGPTAVNNLTLFWSEMFAGGSDAPQDINGQSVCLSRYINVQEPFCSIEGLNVTGGFFVNYYGIGGGTIRTTRGLSEAFTKVHGNQTLTVGGTVLQQYASENALAYPALPVVGFSNAWTGFGLADFLLGDVNTFLQGAGEISSVKGWQPGVFVQDVYRFKPNVTLTAGVRWDPNLPPASTGGRGAAFRPGEQSQRFPNAPLGEVFPGDPGVDDGLMPSTYRYVQPRVGLAWQPEFVSNLSVRAGFGMFVSPIAYSQYNHVADIAPFSPTFTLYANAATNQRISFDDPWATFAATGGTSPFPPFASLNYKPPTNSTFALPVSLGSVFDNNFRLPMTQSWNLSVEKQISANYVIRAAYVGSQSYHLPLNLDENPGVNNVRTTYPNFGNILEVATAGTASYHALQLGFEKRLSHGIQFQSNYTWSKNIDTASAGNPTYGYPLPNPYNIYFNRGISDLNNPYIWVSNFVYTSPSLHGSHKLLEETLGSWEVSSIYTIQGGPAFGIAGGDGNNNSGALEYGDRGNLVPGVPWEVHQGSRQHWLTAYMNKAAFTVNPAGTFGDTGRNFLRGPRVNSADAALAKNWQLERSLRLQFRWEMFNAFNHTSFGTPSDDPSTTTFGNITSVGAIPPRVMQGALKLIF